MTNTRHRGFTLIELLIVIAIIGILSSVTLAFLTSARARARDTKRLAEQRQVVTAMNIYLLEHGQWPPTDATWNCLGPSSESCFGGLWTGSNELVTALSEVLPVIPTNNAQSGTMGYNRLMYSRSVTPFVGAETGAYLVWIQEENMPASLCPPAYTFFIAPYYFCNYFMGR